MPIRLGLMELILPSGYFSVAFLTLLAAVVIGALWVGWGSPSPAEEKKKANSVPSPKRKEKEDACADVAPVPAALEKRDAFMELVPTAAPMEKEKDALEKNDSADIAPVPVSRGKMDALTKVAPTAAPMEKEKVATAVDICAAHAVEGENKIHELVENLAPTPASMEKEKDAHTVDLCAAHAVEGEKRIHELVEEAGVASVTGEAGDLTAKETSLPTENTNELNGTTSDQAAEEPEIRGMTLEELEAYDGTDAERPLLMAIKGQIYDVSKSRNLYGPGGLNELFGGRDASRALATMSFDPEDLTGNIDDLEEEELDVLGDWEQKFMVKYPIVGKLVAAV